MKVLVFGATGSAGGSVLGACLDSPLVTEVRAIVRRPLDVSHEKLRVVVHQNFLDYAGVEESFDGVDAVFYCLGISATQVSAEAEYRTITHDFALAAARTLKTRSPSAAFHYISGQGTSADSRMMWARVKAETERELMDRVGAVCWRPAFIDGATSASAPRAFQALRPVFRLLSPFPSLYVKGEDIGRAMVRATTENIRGRVIENPEIRAIAKRAAA
jgi:uncharacterized protein YbjT (DUF2867 family)